ncbi:MAG: regulatory protein RecX [Balneolaceae bacterium]
MNPNNEHWNSSDEDLILDKLPLQVTSIRPQLKRPDRFSLFHKKTFLLGVSSQTLLDFPIQKGVELTPSLYLSLKESEEYQNVKDRCYRLLSGRDHAAFELRQKMAKKGFLSDITEKVIEEFLDRGFLDDEKYAKKFAADKANLKQWGPVKIKIALQKKGIKKSVAEKVVEKLNANLEQDQICVDLALKRKAHFLREPEFYKRKQKIYRYLAGKGYTGDQIKKALPIILEKLNV